MLDALESAGSAGSAYYTIPLSDTDVRQLHLQAVVQVTAAMYKVCTDELAVY
jgi:hypothetical protein